MKQEHAVADPSAWVMRFAERVPVGGTVLDLACGSGRHTRLFLARGYRVLAVDQDLSGIEDLANHANLERVQADLEDGQKPPFAARRFDGVVVVNYLHRPLLPALVSSVAPGGILIYQTFARGNERFGRPRNPDFLLRPGELLEAVAGQLRVMAYEDVIVTEPRPAALQRIAAANDLP